MLARKFSHLLDFTSNVLIMLMICLSLILRIVTFCTEKTFITYNIHYLIHLAQVSQRFGLLESSPIKFLNNLGINKRLIRKSDKPLQQVVKTLAEIEKRSLNLTENPTSVKLQYEHSKGPRLTAIID